MPKKKKKTEAFQKMSLAEFRRIAPREWPPAGGPTEAAEAFSEISAAEFRRQYEGDWSKASSGAQRSASGAGRRDPGPEHRMQARFFLWRDAAVQGDTRYRDVADGLSAIYAVPNGGHRSRAAAGKMKAEGQRAGVPDVCVPVPMRLPDGRTYGALYVELKVSPNTLSPAQQEAVDQLRRLGNEVVVVFDDWQEVRNVVVDYLRGTLRPGTRERPFVR